MLLRKNNWLYLLVLIASFTTKAFKDPLKDPMILAIQYSNLATVHTLLQSKTYTNNDKNRYLDLAVEILNRRRFNATWSQPPISFTTVALAFFALTCMQTDASLLTLFSISGCIGHLIYDFHSDKKQQERASNLYQKALGIKQLLYQINQR